MKPKLLQIIGKEDGSLSFIALLIMVTLAVAGLMVTNDAFMESKVGRNYAIHKQCVSSAEAAGKEFIQAIDSIFLNSDVSSSQAIADLSKKPWNPYDNYNAVFVFDEDNWGTYHSNNKTKPTIVESSIGYLESANAIAVLVNQTTSVMNPGLGGAKVPECFSYVFYCRAVHLGAENSEAILMIGYKQIWGI